MENSGKNGDPVLLKDMIADWPAAKWTMDNLQLVFENEPLRFRIGNACYNGMALFSWIYAHQSLVHHNNLST